ncbi:substrate-binding domain-containing protein [Treponema pectinovorum]|uniref:substrate-binding domain-containing protein n=1 Tax=Treponema pectinovorum TaxID=164 RepID=UPI0011C86069|nr:substrate-binding domain-containing protein [Treponema pectinovorum]
MNQSIAKRRAFLTGRKNHGSRVTIGFTGIADFRSFIGQEYIAGMMKAASDYDLNFINFAGAIKYSLFDDIDFISHYLKNFRFMKAPLVDGLVTWASSLCSFLDNKTLLNTFNALKPLPMVDIGYLDIEGIPCIRIDNTSSIALLISHLVHTHGYKNFIFMGSKVSEPHLRRLEAYKAELKKYGIAELPNSIYMTKTMDSIDIAMAVNQLCSAYNLKNRSQIDCIITTSDIIAEIVIEELDKKGINVPSDVAITGFNNQYNGINARSPVTTMNLEYFRRGYAAVELLIDRIMNPETKYQTRLVPTTILLRQSCGCFEQSILDAGKPIENSIQNQINPNSSEEEVRNYLLNQTKNIFTHQTEKEIEELIDSIFLDIYEPSNPSAMLRWFQRMLQDIRKDSTLINNELQQSITNLRRVILPMVHDDEKQFSSIENIFHQLRALVSVFIEYDTLSTRENSYMMNNMSQIAMNFASATTGRQIQDVLRYQLSEMEIPGIILCLSDNMTMDLSASNIELILPEPPSDIKEKLPFKIYDPSCIPRNFFPQGRRYSLMLEILYHADRYFGYAFLEIGTPNISVYDTVRMLLSNALYSVYLKEGRTKERSMLLSGEQLVSILHLPSENDQEIKNGITVRQITNYLVENLNKMTNLDKMAEDLMVSKSHLVRRAKELTGFTIQNLHEKLKIEQAKNLLQVESIKLSEIASRLGFQNQNYFSSVFKKNTGMSPRAWAHRYR